MCDSWSRKYNVSIFIRFKEPGQISADEDYFQKETRRRFVDKGNSTVISEILKFHTWKNFRNHSENRNLEAILTHN